MNVLILLRRALDSSVEEIGQFDVPSLLIHLWASMTVADIYADSFSLLTVDELVTSTISKVTFPGAVTFGATTDVISVGLT